jgi:hypothetical protein
MLYIISFFFGFIGPFPFTTFSHVTLGGLCPRGTSFTLSTLSAPVLLPSVHVPTLRLSLSCTYVETYWNTYGNTYGNLYFLLFLVFALSWSLFCRLPASLLSRCSGSDDTSPSSSLLPLPHCDGILSLLCCCLLALCLGDEYLFPPRGVTPSVSLSASDGW